jgi:hypothetical protein
MFDDAAQALEEIEPEDKTRIEVIYARVDIYLGARKWHLAAVGLPFELRKHKILSTRSPELKHSSSLGPGGVFSPRSLA